MKKTLLAVTLAALTSGAATSVLAADPKTPAPEFEISGNFGLFSDYRFRGISQTDRKAAVQGGFDLSHKSGFYIGNWNSNVHNFYYPGASMESDIYGGFITELGPVEANIGVLRYMYPGNTGNSANTNTTEAYLSITYGPVSYKFSRSDGNYFGTPNTKGTTYNELNFSYDLNDKVSVSAHAGKTNIAKTSSGDYSDYKIGITYALPDDYSLGLAYFNNSGLDAAEKSAATSTRGEQLYKSTAVISLSKTF
jgi:uncharacterized protein (TIGR02001 family)